MILQRGDDAILGVLESQHKMMGIAPGQPQEWIINHLTSETGKALNGKRCRIIGRDPWNAANADKLRMHVRVNGVDVRIRAGNLIPLEQYRPNPGPLPDVTLATLRRAVKAVKAWARAEGYMGARAAGGQSERHFRARRLDALFPGPKLSEWDWPSPNSDRCMDGCFPRGYELTRHDRLMAAIKPGCIGDGTVDFRRFGWGLGSDGEERLTRRVREWVVSGFCERCQYHQFAN